MKKGRNSIVAVAIALAVVLSLAPRVAAAGPPEVDRVDCTLPITFFGGGQGGPVVISVPRFLAKKLNAIPGIDCPALN